MKYALVVDLNNKVIVFRENKQDLLNQYRHIANSDKTEKYIRLIETLINQGYSKQNIERYIKTLQKIYTPDDKIYCCLKDFYMDEYELSSLDLKKRAYEALECSILLVEAQKASTTKEGAKNYKKRNPIYTKYIAEQENLKIKK